MEYSEKFKAALVRRMAGPRAVSASALEAEVGVPQPTLSRWLREAGSVDGMAGNDGRTSVRRVFARRGRRRRSCASSAQRAMSMMQCSARFFVEKDCIRTT